MSDNIDEKVIQMRFDNKQFEANVKQSMSTLDKLKAKLNFKSVSNDIDELDKTIKKTDLSPLGKAAETVSLKFDALGIAGTTALANITNSAVNAGKRLVSAFTIDPIKSGFKEYETQINAVQTILANTSSKGTTLDEVNAALDELNTYADKTIYNFTEMTRNIGTFTAAGVGLKESTAAIQGIANLAAVSGSNAQQASTAMYQLSQALSAGTVKLQDWNSVVNAGMGGQVFQDALKKTAEAYGTNVDALIEKNGSFRESLKEGWITSEILTETLSKMTKSGAAEYLSKLTGISQDHIKATQELVAANEDGSKSYDELAEEMAKTGKVSKEDALEILKMADTAEDAATKVKTFTQLMDTLKEAAQSGWTQTWEIIVGDFGEAKELFTEISDYFGKIIGDASDARNTLLEGAMAPAWEQISKKIEDAGIPLDSFQNKLMDVARSHGIAIDKMIEEDGSFEKTLKRGWLSGSIISETISKFIGGINSASESTENLANDITNLGDVVNKVIRGDFGNGADRIKALTEAGYDYATVQGLVNRTLAGEIIDYENLSDAQMKNIGFTDEQIKTLRQLQLEAEATGTPLNELIANMSKPSGRELLIDSFRNALKGLMTAIGAVKEAWTDIFPPMTSNQLYGIIENIHKLSEYLVMNSETADKLKRSFKGLFAIIDIIRTIAGGALSIALKIAANVLGLVDVNVLDLTASVGDAIVAFRNFLFENNKITNAFVTVIEWIAKACVQIKEWFNAFLALPEVEAKITGLKAVFVDVLTGIQDYFAGGIEKINEFIGRIKSMDSITLDSIGTILKDFRDNVIGYFFDFNEGFGKLGEVLSNFKSGIKETFSNVYEKLSEAKTNIFNFVDSVMDKFGSVAAGGLITVGFGAALISFAKTLSKIFDKINGVRDGFVEVLESLSGALDAYANDKKSDKILKYAGSIAILAASLALISLIPSEKLWSSVGALGAIAGGMVALSAVLALLPKATTINNSSLSVVAFAGAVLILINALKKMEELNPNNVLDNLGPISLIMIELAGISVLMSKFSSKFKMGILVVPALASGVLILVEAIKRLSELSAVNHDLEKNVHELYGIIGSLSALCLACSKIKLSGALGIISVVASIGLLVKTLKILGEFDIRELSSSLGKIILVVGVFALLMKSTKNAGQYAKEGGAGVLMMSAAMIVLAQAFKTLSKIDKGMINKSLLSISTMLVLFGAITALSKFAGEHAAKAGVMLLLMSGAIAILAGVMFGLSLIASNNPEGLDKALSVILWLEGAFAALIAVSKLATDCQKTLTRLIIAIGVLSAAIGILSCLDTDGLKTAAIAISSVIGAFTLLVGISKLAGNSVKTIVILTVAVTLLSGALYAIASLPVQATISTAGALSTLMVALSASLLMIGAAKEPSLSAIGALAGIALVTAGLSAVIGWLESAGLSVSIENAISLSVLAVALSGAMLILSKVGPVAGEALKGAGVLLLAVTAFGAVFYGLGILIEECGVDPSKIDPVIEVFEKVGEAIGAIFGGAFAGLASGLPAIGAYISKFTENLAPFLTDVKGINGDTLKGVASLVGAVLLITAGELLSGIMNFLGLGTNTLNGSLGKDLCGFGQTLIDYAAVVNQLSDKDIKAIEDSAEAARALSDLLVSVPNSGGLLAELVGDNTWDTFREGLPEFGEALVTYSESVSELDEDKIKAIESSVGASKNLCSLLDAVPNSGGMLAELVGDNTWDTFRAGLPEFGEALVTYSESVSELDETKTKAIENSVGAAGQLNELLKAMPNSGGFAASLLGDNTWETFMDGLVAFGGQLTAYSIIVDNCHVDAITNSNKAVNGLIELLDSMPNSGGVAGFFAGDNTWEKFGKGLVEFAGTLRDYADVIKDVDLDNIISSSAAIDSIITTISGMSSEKSFKKIVSNFGKATKELGECVSDYSEVLSTVDLNKVSTATSNLLNLVTIVKEASGVNTDGISKLKNGIEELGTISVDEFVNQFSNSSEKIKMAGIDLVKLFIEGTNSKTEELKNTMADTVGVVSTELIMDMKNSERAISDQFKNSGFYIVQGLVQGINSSTPFVKTAMIKLSEEMQKTFCEENDINSPSKDYEEYGGYIDQGIVKGIDSGLDDVIDSVVTIGECMKQNFMASSDASDAGSNFIQTFKDEISTGKDGILSNISSLGSGIVDKFKGFAGKLSDTGLGSILSGNINMESLLGGKFDFDLSSLTSASEYEFSELSKEQSKLFTAAKKEFDAMLENYKNGRLKQADYDKQYTALLKKYSGIQANVAKYAIEQTLPLAKKEYDALLEDYKNGKIKQAEYDEGYLKILEKYKAAEIDIYKYAQSEIEELTSKNLETLNKTFEDEIKDIQQKIDSYASKMTGSFDSMLTYTTNKDAFDETTKEYNEKLSKLNEEHKKAISLYGEESWAAQNYQRQIDNLTASYEKYKAEYEKNNTNDDEIIGVQFTNKIKQSTKEIEEYTNALKKLTARNINSDMIDAIASMDREKGLATVNYLNSLSDKELEAVIKNWDKYVDATSELSKTLYSDEMKKATEKYVASVIEELSTLPDSATAIGVNMVKGLALGFSEETEKSLAEIGQSSESIVKFIKSVFGIHSPSRVFKDEIGSNLAKGLCSGFTDEMEKLSGDIIDSVPVNFDANISYNISENTSALSEAEETIAKLTEMIQNDTDIQPTISPILDLSNVSDGIKTIDTMMNKNYAVGVGGLVEESRNTRNSTQETTNNNSSSFAFYQYNTSPKALSRKEIRNETMQGLQLAKALR